MRQNLRVDGARLSSRLEQLAEMGALPGGGVCRLALSEADKAGRDLVVRWMRELGLAVSIDAIGNVVAIRAGKEDGAPVMMGSHIDTVATGGRYDGALGVLAGLEVLASLDDASHRHAAAAGGRLLHQRGRVALSARHVRQPRLHRRPAARSKRSQR